MTARALPTHPDDHVESVAALLDRLPRALPRAGVVHVGAHQGEEVGEYLKRGFRDIVLVEANPRWFRFLKRRFSGYPSVRVFHYAVSDESGSARLYLHTSRSGSTEPASLLRLKEFKRIVRTLHTPRGVTVPAITLDELAARHLRAAAPSLLNLDIQGAELRALRGGGRLLRRVSAVICEVALLELYESAPLEREIAAHLAARGFRKKAARYHALYDETGQFPAWGEALFTRTR